MQRGTGNIGRRTALLGGIAGAAALLGGCAGNRSTSGSSPSAGGVSGTPDRSAQPSASSPTPTTTSTASPPEIAARATVPVLCYHQLRDYEAADSEYARSVLICPPANFRKHLDAIKDDGWTTIGPDDYYEHLTAGSPLPDKPVLLTFDDGTIGQLTEGMEQLVKREMTGTFFPMTVVLGKPGWMSTQDIRRLADAGMTVGSHTWDHHPVSELGAADWAVQLERPRQTLREASGQPVDHLAYPYGSWNPPALPHVAAAGYKTAYQLQDEPLDPKQPLLTLQRSLVRSDWTGAQLLDELRKHSAA